MEAPVSSYSYIRLKILISGGGQLQSLLQPGNQDIRHLWLVPRYGMQIRPSVVLIQVFCIVFCEHVHIVRMMKHIEGRKHGRIKN